MVFFLCSVSPAELSALPPVYLFPTVVQCSAPCPDTEFTEDGLGEWMHSELVSELGNSVYLGLEGFKMSLARQPQVANQLQD